MIISTFDLNNTCHKCCYSNRTPCNMGSYFAIKYNTEKI